MTALDSFMVNSVPKYKKNVQAPHKCHKHISVYIINISFKTAWTDIDIINTLYNELYASFH